LTHAPNETTPSPRPSGEQGRGEGILIQKRVMAFSLAAQPEFFYSGFFTFTEPVKVPDEFNKIAPVKKL
jgi:hypothetical protein